jgi:hypothetical protein
MNQAFGMLTSPSGIQHFDPTLHFAAIDLQFTTPRETLAQK